MAAASRWCGVLDHSDFAHFVRCFCFRVVNVVVLIRVLGYRMMMKALERTVEAVHICDQSLTAQSRLDLVH